MRSIALHPDAQEPPLSVYDCSGPYTDPAVHVDISKGLPITTKILILGQNEVMQSSFRSLGLGMILVVDRDEVPRSAQVVGEVVTHAGGERVVIS